MDADSDGGRRLSGSGEESHVDHADTTGVPVQQGIELPEIPEVDTEHFPRSIYFIMSNEFCERFSFYGLKAILVLYLADFLGFSEDTATFALHSFIFFAYAMSVVGGYISDSFLGKYRTILYLSLVYCVGTATVSLTAVPGVMPGDPPQWWGAAIGLFLVGIGTGGIKSCVSSFVGDQFVPGQEALLASVFSLFYFFVNAGSFCSTIITPLLRVNVGFAAAFMLPAILLVVSTLIFFSGRNTYRIIPPGPNVLKLAVSVIASAFRQWFRFRNAPGFERPPHFLDYAKATHENRLVDDVKAALSVFAVFLPLPVFWALFDQHASRWVFQARLMSRDFCFVTITPDQVPTLNPLLLLSLIPVFNKVVYPQFEKLGFKMKPLEHRMSIGMSLTALSFLLSGILQLAVQAHPGEVSVAWQFPQYFVLCCGEIMVSITGLEFAYSQAPKSMKSVVMAGWLLTTAFGNLLVAVIAEANLFSNVAYEMFFFSGMMVVFVGIFLVVVLFICKYQYKDTFSEEDVEEQYGAVDGEGGVRLRMLDDLHDSDLDAQEENLDVASLGTLDSDVLPDRSELTTLQLGNLDKRRSDNLHSKSKKPSKQSKRHTQGVTYGELNDEMELQLDSDEE
eukprot:CAMPEP_0174241798 /NCGR_PEP_ID=MMETSP0417-20130205/24875_1 /TAXON_ID=242541 /ORGANISM="Mayorella sp, Strain BSH-02190019" /LENGTH=619 /DNA_ID=CAMNT_0015321095 /DNA_START=24 /DNA_END=1883 /DNA_ORIENTATION=+